MHFSATQSSFTLPALPTGTASIDVLFDAARVWSIDVRERVAAGQAGDVISWPAALVPFLSGSTRLSINDSATGAELAATDIAFTRDAHRTSVIDAAGNALVINKWDHLGVALADMGAEVQALIVQRAAEIVKFLDERELRPFIVGGTLLGAVRSEALLPHDDDADIAYLSHLSHPADLAREAFQLGHDLTAAGYEIRRHSAAHMQLLFRDAAGTVQHYIDVFTAFFTPDGHVNQPFHVRGEMHVDQMLPFQQLRVGEVEFPAPADTDRWLTINYDENWRTPIPGYRLVTPEPTRRRFNNWFGSFNLHREFWEEQFAAAAATTSEVQPGATEVDGQWELGRRWLADSVDSPAPGNAVIDLGCGAGTLTHELAAQHPGLRVIGVDFCDAALARAASNSTSASAVANRPEFSHVNLYRATAIALPHDLGISGAFDLVSNHVCEQLGHLGRESFWRLNRMALRSGGSARFTFHAAPAADVTFEDPTGWHLTREQVEAEAAGYGLSVAFEQLDDHAHGAHSTAAAAGRAATGATLMLATAATISVPFLAVNTGATAAPSGGTR